jgi:hypothetical protein
LFLLVEVIYLMEALNDQVITTPPISASGILAIAGVGFVFVHLMQRGIGCPKPSGITSRVDR